MPLAEISLTYEICGRLPDNISYKFILALSQRLSPLGLIFRFSISTSDKIILVNFRIS